MLKLHGIPISNYFSSVKTALLEKDLAFEEIAVFPSRKADVLAVSPMGKVPWLDIDGTKLSETNVIYDYLEDIQAAPALYPGDALARAKVKEIVRVIEHYIDLPARRHIASVYFGADVDAHALDEVRPALENGLEALKKVAKFGPYIAGAEFTFADITAYFQLRFANLHTQKIYAWDFIAADADLTALMTLLIKRPSIAAVDGAMQQAMSKFLPA
jgi:glutathione S-transferase